MAHLAPPQRTQGFEKVPSGRSPLSALLTYWVGVRATVWHAVVLKN